MQHCRKTPAQRRVFHFPVFKRSLIFITYSLVKSIELLVLPAFSGWDFCLYHIWGIFLK